MRRMLAVTAAIVVGVGIAIAIDARGGQAEGCFSSTVYDGVVLPGGPQTANEALVGYLSVNEDDELPRDLEDYDRIQDAEGAVRYVAGDVTIQAGQRPNGWWIGSVEVLC